MTVTFFYAAQRKDVATPLHICIHLLIVYGVGVYARGGQINIFNVIDSLSSLQHFY